MPTKLDDYVCPICERSREVLVHTGSNEDAEDLTCPTPDCEGVLQLALPAGHQFTTIVPTTLTSKKHKAGYAHKYVNRPATKTQVGFGGGVTKGTDDG